MSSSSFSHSVFKRLALQTRKNQGLFGKGLKVWIVLEKVNGNPLSHSITQTCELKVFPNEKLHLDDLDLVPFVSQRLKKVWAIENMLQVTSIFSFSHNVFKGFLSLGLQIGTLCSIRLTVYHTIPSFNDPESEAF